MQSSFDVSRKKAADILGVSTRTLDRYVKKKVLSSKSIAGRIFLNREEVNAFSKQKRKHRSVKKTTASYISDVHKNEIELYKQELSNSQSHLKQLEFQIENSVSAEEYRKSEHKRQEELFNKRVLYVLLGILLLAQPLWLFLVYS